MLGFSEFYSLFILDLPPFVAFYMLGVGAICLSENASIKQYMLGDQYFKNNFQSLHGLQTRFLVLLWYPSVLLGLCGVLLVLIGLYTPSLYGSTGCVDPMLRVSIAVINPTSLWQYTWVVMNVMVLGLVIH